MVFKDKTEVAFKTETLAYLAVFANMQQLMNVKANLVVTSNQLGCNNDCYDEFHSNRCYIKAGRSSCNEEAGLNSCYDKTGRNSCYDKAG